MTLSIGSSAAAAHILGKALAGAQSDWTVGIAPAGQPSGISTSPTPLLQRRASVAVPMNPNVTQGASAICSSASTRETVGALLESASGFSLRP